MTNRLFGALTPAVLASAAIAFAACGEDSDSGAGNAGGNPATVAPASAPLYIEGVVRPGGGQKTALDGLVSKVAGDRDIGKDIKELIDKEIQDTDKDDSFDNSIEPWLGDRAAVFVDNFTSDMGDIAFAIVVASKDNGKAEDVLKEEAEESDDPKKEYKGIDYTVDKDDETASGLIGDFVVVGDEVAFKKAVDASNGGGTLAESQRFKSATAQLPAERLGYGYLDGKSFLDGIQRSGSLPPGFRDALEVAFGSAAKASATFSAVAKSNGLLIETATRSRAGFERAPLLDRLPGDSFVAFAAPDVGGQLRKLLRTFASLGSSEGVDPEQLLKSLEAPVGIDLQRDVLSWLGDVAIFARGDNFADLSGGLIVTSKDRAASARAIERIQRIAVSIARAQGARVSEAPGGFRVTHPRLPGPIQVVQRGDKVVIAYGNKADDAASPATTLKDSPAFRAAQQTIGSDVVVGGFIDIEAVVRLLELFGISRVDGYSDVKPYLDTLDALVFGSKQSGGQSVGRLLISTK